MNRNYSIDFIKFIFAIFISLGHYGYEYISSGTIVDCFFVISGYYLVESFNSNKFKNAFEYTTTKVKRVYIYYLISFIIVFTFRNIKLELPSFIYEFFTILPEIFIIQNIGYI